MIAFDLDDTLGETQKFLDIELKEELGIDNSDPQTWIVIPGMSEEQVNQIIWECVAKVTKLYLLPKPGTELAVQEIHIILKQSMHIVTARQTMIKNVTEEWTKQYFGDDVRTHFVLNREKKDYLVKLGIKYWVDDRSDVVLECCSVMEKVFMMNKPWNENTILPSNGIRIDHVEEIIPHIS